MRLLIAIIALVAVAFSGCFGSTEYGAASIYVKDAPTDEFSEIHVVFTEVRVHGTGNGSDDDEGEWLALFENENGTDVDLLATSGPAAAFLGEEDIPVGNYTQIRVIVQSAYGVDQDGNTVNITVSSSTLKIIRPFEVTGDEEAQIIVDVDLDRSLTETGNGAWRMAPVVGKVTVNHVDDDASGEDVADEGDIEEVSAQ